MQGREPEEEEGSRERGRSERGSGRCRGTRGGVQKRRKQEVARRVGARGEHTLGVLLARWRRRLASASWVGPHSVGLSGGLAGGLCQVSGQVLLSLSLS